MEWQDRAADKKSRIAASIPQEWRIDAKDTPQSAMDYPRQGVLLDVNELAITESSATELVKKLATGELTSIAVTNAFCKRAALAHQLLNCCLEFFPDMALQRAKELDEFYAKNKRTVGPLHGLPISLKDQFRIKGLETTMGYVDWIGKYETGNSVMVDLLFKAGAVLYTKTSVPQSLMLCETLNNIIGRTVNPRNKDWACGGSSGGEGALIGFRGGVIGVGTDIGGSIRVPAAFNYLYGIRPSHGRLPYGKMANSMEGQETVHSVSGPLCHSISDMRLFMTSVLAGKPWDFDSKVIPMPWRESEEAIIKNKVSSPSLTLGFYTSDGVVLPHPPILRGIRTVVQKLQEAGHTVVPWEPYKHDEALSILGKVYAADGGADIRSVLEASGEPNIPNISHYVQEGLPKTDINDLWSLHLDKWSYQCEYLAAIRALEEKLGKELDAIIAPVAPTAAIRHNKFEYYGYTTVVNLLDFTSVVVPVTFADKAVDMADPSHKPLNETDAIVQGEYDPGAYHGAPVAVQIIGRRLTEERTMAIAEEIGRLLGNETAS